MTPQKQESVESTSVLERMKRHWLISTLLVCVAVAGATWKAATELLVVPRDFEIARLKEQSQRNDGHTRPTTIDSMNQVLPETGVSEGSAVTTKDGRCLIRIAKVEGDTIHLTAALDANKPTDVLKAHVGSRISVTKGSTTYYADIQRVRGSIVDLVVYKRAD